MLKTTKHKNFILTPLLEELNFPEELVINNQPDLFWKIIKNK